MGVTIELPGAAGSDGRAYCELRFIFGRRAQRRPAFLGSELAARRLTTNRTRHCAPSPQPYTLRRRALGESLLISTRASARCAGGPLSQGNGEGEHELDTRLHRLDRPQREHKRDLSRTADLDLLPV